MSTTRRLLVAIATLATLAAIITASGSSATAQPTADAAVLTLEADDVLADTHCSAEDCEGDLMRWEAALWFTNALGLSLKEAVSFHDVPANGALGGAVSSLYGDGVTVGCPNEPLRYCPDDHMTRAQMASFLARAFDLEAGEPGVFADVNPDSVHAANIAAIWEAGITEACGTEPLRYCPSEPVTRKQAALMLYRALQRHGSGTDSSTVDTTAGPFDPAVDPASPNPTVPDGPTSTVPTDPTTDAPTDTTVPTVPPVPTVPTVPPVRPGCAVVDHFDTHHDIDDHGRNPAGTAYALLADGTLFKHRHVTGGGARCWMWLPRDPNGNQSLPINAQAPSHTH